MDLSTLLPKLSREKRLDVVRRLYKSNPNEKDTADMLIDMLSSPRNWLDSDDECRRASELGDIVDEQIRIAREEGDEENVTQLGVRFITSHASASDIERLAKQSGDVALVEAVIERYRGEHWHKGQMVMNLLEHLGKDEEARAYALEAISVLNKKRKDQLSHGGRWGNHGIDRLYVRLGMYKEAVEVRFDDGDFTTAIKLAKEYLPPGELPDFYRRVHAAAEGDGHDNGYPLQLQVARLLGDKKLEEKTGKAYLRWALSERDKIYFPKNFKQFATSAQLRELHERLIVHRGGTIDARYDKNKSWHSRDLAEATEDAFNDLGTKRYGQMAMEEYEGIEDFAKALKLARAVAPKKVELYENLVRLVNPEKVV